MVAGLVGIVEVEMNAPVATFLVMEVVVKHH
jgi:hypothetical protein